MKFLVVNDDGYQAEGIKLLVNNLKKYGDVVVYSPYKCESAQSHKITIKVGIKVERIDVFGVESYTVHGSAADCVRIGLFLHPDTTLVLSGINHGLNVGHDIYYSSTISAIVEAGMQGYRGVALSCDRNYDDIKNNQLESLLEEVVLNNDKYAPLINVNFPISKFTNNEGIKKTVGGKWHYANKFVLKNGLYFESDEIVTDEIENNDGYEVANGYVSISNITLQRTYKD